MDRETTNKPRPIILINSTPLSIPPPRHPTRSSSTRLPIKIRYPPRKTFLHPHPHHIHSTHQTSPPPPLFILPPSSQRMATLKRPFRTTRRRNPSLVYPPQHRSHRPCIRPPKTSPAPVLCRHPTVRIPAKRRRVLRETGYPVFCRRSQNQ